MLLRISWPVFASLGPPKHLQENAPPSAKGHPWEDPTLGWVEMEVKGLGQKEETEPETELSKRNLVKKKEEGTSAVTSGMLKLDWDS